MLYLLNLPRHHLGIKASHKRAISHYPDINQATSQRNREFESLD